MAYADRTTDPMDTPARPSAAPTSAAPRSGAARRGSAVRPAHPLPTQRSGTLDYDRYLERSTSKFKIFSAEERRKRKRTAVAVGAILVVVAVIVVWAICSQG